MICVLINVDVLGSDSTPPPVSKMSPVSNKFEGIPQQQRYKKKTKNHSVKLNWLKTYKYIPVDDTSIFWDSVFYLKNIFPVLLQATQSRHLVQGFFPNYLRKVRSLSGLTSAASC